MPGTANSPANPGSPRPCWSTAWPGYRHYLLLFLIQLIGETDGVVEAHPLALVNGRHTQDRRQSALRRSKATP